MMNNGKTQPSVSSANQTYFLSEIIGAKVYINGKKVGTLTDLVIIESGIIPEVKYLVIHRPFGHLQLLIPWDQVVSLTIGEVVAAPHDLKAYEGVPAENAILLRDYILDKKVLDIEDREVEVVYDVKLVIRNQKLYVTDVDTSRYGLLRRIGLKGLANFIYSLAEKIQDQTISWTLVQPLPTDISSFKGDVKLKVLKETLSNIHPVDLADIIEDLDHDQRLALFGELDTERASDTLEEIDPHVQRDLVSSLGKDKVVLLLNQMTPAQAADILSVLPSSESQPILELMNKDYASKIRAILEKQEERVIHYTTTKFLQFSTEATVMEAQKEYQQSALDKDVVMYLYILDENSTLRGIIDIKELLQAPLDAELKDVMVENIISLKPDSTLKEAAAIFARYDFRAIPVTTDDDKMVGVIPYRDVMRLTHHFLE